MVKKILKFLFSRLLIIGVFLLLQVILLIFLIQVLSDNFVYVYSFFVILSSIIVIWLVNKNDNSSIKISWIILVMLFPVFGGLLYIMFGTVKIPKPFKEKMDMITEDFKPFMPLNNDVAEELRNLNPNAASQSFYIKNQTDMPAYKNTTSHFLALGEIKFAYLKEELEKAEHFILLQYFIIEEGKMWGEILEILKRKVIEGVDVRVMYDDVGCIMTLPHNYNKRLNEMGIKCVVFNPIKLTLTTFLNNRDHRKIAVIDGHTAFTGGINLADEYINAYEKHGHWKDCAVMLKGEAVWSFTLTFLKAWCYYIDTDYNLDNFRPSLYKKEKNKDDGFIQPFSDTPLDHEFVSESVYLNMINGATRSLYICTPYFIIDNEIITALTLASKRGVDVRIITPHIADKWYVHIVTQSYYPQLIKAGIKIYEYTPGFIHAKTFVVDEEIATIGTINIDFRSLFHHYECGVWLYKSTAVNELLEDFLKTQKISVNISYEDTLKVPLYKRMIRALIKLVAPLM